MFIYATNIYQPLTISPGSEDTAANNSKSLPSWSQYSSGKRRTANNMSGRGMPYLNVKQDETVIAVKTATKAKRVRGVGRNGSDFDG